MLKLQETWSECWDGFNERLLALESSLQELIRNQQNTIKALETKLLSLSAQSLNTHEPMETNEDEHVEHKEETDSPLHFKWLESEFKKRFQLPINIPQKKNIWSYDGTLIARGWNKIETTYQGMYFEIDEKDIAFGNLLREDRHDEIVLSTRGVRIFSLKSPDTRSIPRPHRFAVSPPVGYKQHCNPLIPGRFYAHVYQTKVETSENVVTTLQSKWTARELRKICVNNYLPIRNDLDDSTAQPYPRQNEAARSRIQPNPNEQILHQAHRPAILQTAYPTETSLNNFQGSHNTYHRIHAAPYQADGGNNAWKPNPEKVNTWAQIVGSKDGRTPWPYNNQHPVIPQNNLYSWQPVQNLAYYPATTHPIGRNEIPQRLL